MQSECNGLDLLVQASPCSNRAVAACLGFMHLWWLMAFEHLAAVVVFHPPAYLAENNLQIPGQGQCK